MCGIAGVVGPGAGSWGREALAEALRLQLHRGPDDGGTFFGPDVALGMRRLSIIDVAGGHQPLSRESSGTTVVFNGEIYNHVELRRDLARSGSRFQTQSDTEVLVAGYEADEKRFVDGLRGMFAFAIWDRRHSRLVLGRDRFGKKPLWVARTERGTAFASELKSLRPLLAALGLPTEIDPQAIYDYLSLGVVPQPRSVFRGVRMLPPASLAVVEDGATVIRRYWTPSFLPKDTRPRQAILEEVRERVRQAVHLRLRSDVPVGIFLSGGVDSSVVALEAAVGNRSDLVAFTVHVPDAALDESAVAKRTAATLGIPIEELELTYDPAEIVRFIASHYDQPFADSSAVPSVALARLASRRVKVVLNGDGGDEVFCGYRRYVGARWQRAGSIERSCLIAMASASAFFRGLRPARRSARGFLERWRRSVGREPGEWYLVSTSDGLLEREKRAAWRHGVSSATESWIAGLAPDGLGPVDTLNAMDLEVNLLSDLLVKVDMASMSASVEARSPFLDHEVATIGFSLPESVRVGRVRTKPVLREAYRDLLPREVVDAPKRGFEVPLSSWLSGPLRPEVDWALASSSSPLRDWLDPAFLADVRLRGGGTPGNGPSITYALLVLALWLDGEASRRRDRNVE